MNAINDALERAANKRLHAYFETLLWSESFYGLGEDGEDPLVIDGEDYESGTPLNEIPGCDYSDVPESILAEAREDLEAFAAQCLEALGIDPFEKFDEYQVAHDFALSRNGHGAGFFDRGIYKIPTVEAPDQIMRLMKRKTYEGVSSDGETIDVGDALQDAAKTFGTHGLSVWQDEPNGPVHMESHS